MEFVLSTKGNDNVLFEQTLLFMMTKYCSKRTHKCKTFIAIVLPTLSISLLIYLVYKNTLL